MLQDGLLGRNVSFVISGFTLRAIIDVPNNYRFCYRAESWLSFVLMFVKANFKKSQFIPDRNQLW